MWDLRGRAKLQMPSTRKTWKATQGQCFAPGLFNLALPVTPLSYTVHTHTWEWKDRHRNLHQNLLWNSNPQSWPLSVMQFLKHTDWCLMNAIPFKYTKMSIFKSLKWDQMGFVWQNRRCGVILDVRQRPSRSQQVAESGCQAPAPASDLVLLPGFKSGRKIFSPQEVITSNTWELSCVILAKKWY